MKYNCPFCNSKMNYHIEDYIPNLDVNLDYQVHECKKSKCRIGWLPKFKIWEYESQVKGFSIVLDNCLTTYKLVSRHDMNKISFSKVTMDLSFNGTIGVNIKNIMELNSAIKIDLANPISSGLQMVDKLLKLRAFS